MVATPVGDIYVRPLPINLPALWRQQSYIFVLFRQSSNYVSLWEYCEISDLFLFSKGRLFDKNGNLVEWWSTDVIKAFKDKAQCFIDQYSQYHEASVNVSVSSKHEQEKKILGKINMSHWQ